MTTPSTRSVPLFRPADLRVDRQTLFELTVEYMAWVGRGIEARWPASAAFQGGSAEGHVAATLDALCSKSPPEGVFYLVALDGVVAGMCGLRRLEDRVAEFKRIYVRPSHRGRGLGAAMLHKLIDDAKAFGCDTAVLDSAPFMQSAQRLYAAAGFVDRPPYPGSEAPPQLLDVWRFMERPL
jgi:GNAT superfamily N-acetyltransferase